MVETIEFKGNKYPKFQSEGNASQFAIPYAKHVCKGFGFDIGYGKPEWKLPEAVGIDYEKECILENTEIKNKRISATSIPSEYELADYIYSSHCLEHLNDWVGVLDYWYDHLKVGGVLFLYLPHPSQEYWLPHNNRKHINILHPDDLNKYFIDKGFKNVFVSGVDLNSSFMIMGEK